MVYKFYNSHDYFYQSEIKGLHFSNYWMGIDPQGLINISQGYAWDGCSPKYHVLDLLIGTPDGAIDPKTKKPLTYYASLIRYALYQFKGDIPFTRNQADEIFRVMLKDSGFFWWLVYFVIVRLFGGFYGS